MSQVTEKMRPDEGMLTPGMFEAMAGQKVQLDVDDAPFLIEEVEPEAPPARVSEDELAKKIAEEEAKRKKKKKIIITLILLLMILFGLVVFVYVFYLMPSTPVEEPFVFVVENVTEPILPPAYATRLEPFWVEMQTGEGNTFFLVCNFVLETENQNLSTEIESRLPVIRDSLFYYLKTKDFAFLTDPINIPAIKEDLLKAVNEYLIQGKLEEILYENYMVR